MKLPNEPLMLCPQDNPSHVGVMNLYEYGDIWIKTKGCEKCPFQAGE